MENLFSLIICRTAVLRNCFLCKPLRWLFLQLIESVKLVKISFSVAICKRQNGKSGNGLTKMEQMVVGIQGTRLRIWELGWKRGKSLWECRECRKSGWRCWEQRWKFRESDQNCGGIRVKMRQTRREKGENHRKFFSLELQFM